MSRNKSAEWLDAPNASADKILRIADKLPTIADSNLIIADKMPTIADSNLIIADKMPTIAPSAQPEWKTLVLLYFISKKPSYHISVDS